MCLKYNILFLSAAGKEKKKITYQARTVKMTRWSWVGTSCDVPIMGGKFV